MTNFAQNELELQELDFVVFDKNRTLFIDCLQSPCNVAHYSHKGSKVLCMTIRPEFLAYAHTLESTCRIPNENEMYNNSKKRRRKAHTHFDFIVHNL